MSFQISALPVETFRPLFGLSDEALAERGVIRRTVDSKPGFPCRVSLTDLEVGESVLLMNYEHQPANTPFRASHAIFVSETAAPADLAPGELPPTFATRFISLRAFDETGMMVNAEVAQGDAVKPAIERLLAGENVAYLHAHYAGAGCYAARIDRH